MSAWIVETEASFDRAFMRLPEYEQAVLRAAIERILTPLGQDVCDTEWGKNLGQGLYEFRVRASLQAISTWGQASAENTARAASKDQKVLLRAFFAVHGSRVVLLFSVYDKKRDPSEKRQNREINKARKLLRAWKSQR